MLNKGAFGKKLFNLLHAPIVTLPYNNPGIYFEFNGEQIPNPPKYEDEFNFEKGLTLD